MGPLVQRLSHRLIDLGFFCALGTFEYIFGPEETVSGVMRNLKNYVQCGEPNKYDQNKGVMVVYDESGRPWIIQVSKITDSARRMAFTTMLREAYNLKPGAYVPHSNDGGFFVYEILPNLR